MPIRSRQFRWTTCDLQPLSELLTPLRRVVEPNGMSATNIAIRPQVTKFYEHGPVLASGHGHASLKQNVWPSLTSKLNLVWRIVFGSERFLEPSFVILCKENYNRVCA